MATPLSTQDESKPAGGKSPVGYGSSRGLDRRGAAVDAYGPWLLGGLALFAMGFFVAMGRGVNMADESWFLQVVHRVTSGDVLYRDVFFGATPLSVYVVATFTTILGSEILVLKAVVTLISVLVILLSCRLARKLGSGPAFPLLLALALAVTSWNWESGAHSLLASVFFLACFGAALGWAQSQTDSPSGIGRSGGMGALFLGGAAAGLSFGSKQTLGLYGLAALLLTVALVSRRPGAKAPRLLSALSLVLGGFGLSAVVVLAPVWLSGGAEKFLDYGFFNKGSYLSLGGWSYFYELGRLTQPLQTPADIAAWYRAYWQQMFLLPPIAFGALLGTRLVKSWDGRGLEVPVLLFVGAAFLDVFPRADGGHLSSAMPEIVLGLTYVWYRIKPGLPRRWAQLARAGVGLWLGVGLVLLLLPGGMHLASGNYQASNLPHFRGALMKIDQLAQISAQLEALKDKTVGEAPFLLTSQAAFYYLAGGLTNPTPFDYPLVTAFGRNGEAEVVAAIAGQQIRSVCVGDPGGAVSALPPRLLWGYIEQNMEPVAQLGFCVLYRARA